MHLYGTHRPRLFVAGNSVFLEGNAPSLPCKGIFLRSQVALAAWPYRRTGPVCAVGRPPKGSRLIRSLTLAGNDGTALHGNTLPCVEATLLSLCLSLSKATRVSLLH